MTSGGHQPRSKSRTHVVEHLANIYAEGELSQAATCREVRQVRTEGTRQVARTLPFYNLDLITDRYKVNSERAMQNLLYQTDFDNVIKTLENYGGSEA